MMEEELKDCDAQLESVILNSQIQSSYDDQIKLSDDQIKLSDDQIKLSDDQIKLSDDQIKLSDDVEHWKKSYEQLKGISLRQQQVYVGLQTENKKLKERLMRNEEDFNKKQKNLEVVDLPPTTAAGNVTDDHRGERDEVIETLTAQLKSSEEQVETLQGKFSELENQRQQLRIIQQGGERVANLKKMEELNKRYENSKKQCEEYQVEIERLKEENAAQQQADRSNGHNDEYAQALENERELQLQLRTYEDELTQKEIKIERLQEAYAQELKRLTELNDNYKEVKLELEIKLKSYDEEVERWKSKCRTLETQLKKVKEDTQTKLEDFKTECEGTIQSLMDKNNVRLKEKNLEVVDLPPTTAAGNVTDDHRGERDEVIETLTAELKSSEEQVETLQGKFSELENQRQQLHIMQQGGERVANLKKMEELNKRYENSKKQCEEYQVEIERLKEENATQQQADRSNGHNDEYAQALENERELQLQLRTYEDELTQKEIKIERLQEAYAQQEERLKENEQKWSEEKDVMEQRVEACNQEFENLSRQRSQLESQVDERANSKETDLLIAQLEAQCQSYEDEVGNLKLIAKQYKEKYGKLKQVAINMREHCKPHEEEIKRLEEENQSLETVRKIQEKDAETEKTAYAALVTKLEKENKAMRVRLEQVPEMEDITRKMKRLCDENDQLRSRMSNYLDGVTSRYNATAIEEKEVVTTRQSQIKSPGTGNRYLSNNNNNNHHKYTIDTGRVLPNRPAGGSASVNPTDYSDYSKYNGGVSGYTTSRQHFRSDNIGKRTKSADNLRIDYDTRDYELDDDSDNGYDNHRNSRYNHRPAYDVKYSSSNTNDLDDIMKKYGGGSSETTKQPTTRHRRAHSSGNFELSNNDSHDSSSYDNTFKQHQPAPRTKSYDRGINTAGTSSYDSSPIFSPRSTSHSPANHQVPFCPTTSRDVRVGMKVSLTHASGRMSRGTVKWIGTLPHHQGDYVGVELESESGKHDGLYEGYRYFKCKKDRGVFVQFKKIIMAWK